MTDTSLSTGSDTDFIRSGLQATRNGEIVLESLFAEWLHSLETLLAAIGESPPCASPQFPQLLALVGRFQRTTFADAGPTVQDRLLRALQIIAGGHQEHYEAAVQFVSRKNFLEDAKRLRKDWSDDHIAHQEAVQMATAILSDWDDTGIILALAGERFDIVPTSEIGRARSEFLDWLCSEGDAVLLLVSERIQTIAAAFDPDLAAKHWELDASTQGYVFLLDTLEEIEKAMDCHPDWIAAKITGLQALLQPSASLPQTDMGEKIRSKGVVDTASTVSRRVVFVVGAALSVLVAVTVLFLSLFQGDSSRSVADARTAWLAKDYFAPPATARSATGSEAEPAPEETEKRRREYETKLTKSPNDVNLLLEYGRFLLRKGRPDEAVTVFEKVQRQAPNNPYAYLGLGIAAVLRGKDAAALERFQEAIDKAETEPWARLYANINAADCCKRLKNSQAHSFTSMDQDGQTPLHLAATLHPNTDVAENLIEKAAEQGDASALFNLASLYAGGQKYAEAIQWFRKAAEQGDASAQFNLGILYAEGHGVSQNYAEAIRWFRKAAEQGDASALFNLGILCAEGHGVSQNYAEAMQWFRKAAEQGNTMAQHNLEILSFSGHGVAKGDKELMVENIRQFDSEEKKHRKAAIALMDDPIIANNPVSRSLVQKLREDVLYELHLESVPVQPSAVGVVK